MSTAATVDRVTPSTPGRQTLLLAGRTVAHWRAQPGPFVVNVLFPFFVMLLMTGLLGGAIAGTTGRYIDFVVPGILAVAMLFGVEQTMLAITTDASRTITDRLRSLPIRAGAIVAGRCLADLLAAAFTLAVTLAGALALGWRPGSGPSLVAALGLLLWFRLGLQAFGVWAGLRVSGPEAVAAVQILVWPVSLLSTVFVDPATMPRWLGLIAEVNPLSSTVTAVRGLLGSPAVGASSWFTEHALVLSVGWPLLLLVVFAPLAARRFRGLAT